MIDMYDMWKSFQSYANTFAAGWYRPQTDFEVACNDISNDLYNHYTEIAERDQSVKDFLIYLLKSSNRKVEKQKAAFGTFAVPDDYGRFSSARIIVDGVDTIPSEDIDDDVCKSWKDKAQMAEDYYDNVREFEVKLVKNQNWASVIAHKTKSASYEKPKATQIDGGFKVAPRTVSVVVLDYYIKPPKAVFGYDIKPGSAETGEGDTIIYNKDKSKPLPWPTTVMNEFLVRLGERFGVFTRDDFMARFSTQQKMTK